MRGPFSGVDITMGKFALAGAGIVEGKDRPMMTHHGVKVMRYDEHSLTQIDEYPDATGWYIDDNGQLDVRNEDCTVHVVASYPSQQWRRVWFPGAETKIKFELLGEDENGEVDDVEPLVYDDVEEEDDVESHKG